MPKAQIPLTVSKRGIDLIKRFEGLRLKAYKDAAGVLTIGYGHTGPDVKTGRVIEKKEAETLLRKDLNRFEAAVRKQTSEVTQDQFDALVAFAFNVGAGALARSTLLKKHKAGDFAGAADQFPRWVRAGGRVLPGLKRRRAAERALYLGKG